MNTRRASVLKLSRCLFFSCLTVVHNTGLISIHLSYLIRPEIFFSFPPITTYWLNFQLNILEVKPSQQTNLEQGWYENLIVSRILMKSCPTITE